MITMFWGPGFSLACSHLLPKTYCKEAESSKVWSVILQLEDGEIPAYQWQCRSLWALLADRIKITFTTILLQNWPCWIFYVTISPCKHLYWKAVEERNQREKNGFISQIKSTFQAWKYKNQNYKLHVNFEVYHVVWGD